MSLPLNEIIHGDCLEVMPSIPDKSIDLIATDPPYNIGKAAWDKIPNYIEWMGAVFLECQRVLRDNGSFYFFHNDFLQIVDLQKWISKNTDFVFKQFITWCKIDSRFSNYGFVQQRLSNGTARNYYNGFTEYCLFYTFQDETGLTTVMLDTNNFPAMRGYFKGLQEWIGLNKKQIMEKIGQRADHCFRWESSQWDLPTQETYQELINVFEINKWQGFKEYEALRREYEALRREYEALRREYEDLRYTYNVAMVRGNVCANSNVWKYPPAPQIGHLTPKPVELMENIILHSSNKGDTIFDPFLGSGTTAIAALNKGRFFVGIEKDKQYFDRARKRIADHEQQLTFEAIT